MKEVQIYTDGACSGNPGPGGYAAVLFYGAHKKECSGGFRTTTNNRMEITAALTALKLLKEPCKVTLYSDSSYLVNSIQKKWIYNWKNNGWKRPSPPHDPIPNTDLWQELLELLNIHEVSFVWVRGHTDNQWNNRCDELARQAAVGENLPEDTGFISRNQAFHETSLTTTLF